MRTQRGRSRAVWQCRSRPSAPGDIWMKMLVLHASERLGLKQEYIQEHSADAGH